MMKHATDAELLPAYAEGNSGKLLTRLRWLHSMRVNDTSGGDAQADGDAAGNAGCGDKCAEGLHSGRFEQMLGIR